jgi:hypothetical protein
MAKVASYDVISDSKVHNVTETEIKIESLLVDLPAEERKGGCEVSGLAVRSLSLEELASVAGGVINGDGSGGTETQKQGTTQDCKNDGYS